MKENKQESKIEVEYEKAQDSAEHYDTMVWTLISVGMGFSILILKTALLDINKENLYLIEPFPFLSLLFFLGAATLIYFGHLIEGANEKRNFKYNICKKIELK